MITGRKNSFLLQIFFRMASIDFHNTVCTTCGDVNGRQVTCIGCQQCFCWTHMTDHQDDIQKQMDNLTQNHKLLKHDWNNDSYHDQLFQQIDQWEKESVIKIQVVADTARADLRLLIKQSTDHLQTSTNKISKEIDRSRQLNNYSEIDIDRWTEQLNNIQLQIQNILSHSNQRRLTNNTYYHDQN